MDIIANAPTERAYERLKSELIRRLAASQEDRIRQVLTQEDIGDRKPSQYLRHLRSKVDVGTIPDNLLRTLWSSRLPQQVKAVIASQNEMSLDAVADLADRVFDAIMPTTQVSAVDLPRGVAAVNPTVTRADYDALAAKVDFLCAQISCLMSQSNKNRYRGRSRRRDRSQSASQSASENNQNICWYHSRYGDQARKCITPCNYPNGGGNRQ